MQSVVRVLGTFTVVLISCMVISHAKRAKNDMKDGGRAKNDINDAYSVRITKSNVSLCEQGKNGWEECEVWSNDELNQFGIFQTREEHRIPARVSHIGCCKTWGLCVEGSGQWLRTVSNRLCYVIQLWDSFQHYSTGTCDSVDVPCSCNGQCQQQSAWISLLAWCPSPWTLKFEQFKIDSYCACVN